MGLLDSLTGGNQQGGGMLGLSQNDLLSLGAGLLSQPTLAGGASSAFQNVQNQRRNQLGDRLKQQQIDINQGNLDLQAQRFGQPKFSNSPIYGQDAQGNTVIGQVNNRGGFQQTLLPEGFTPQRPMQQLNTGTGFVSVPKHGTAAAAGRFTPINTAEAEQQKAIGAGAGQDIAGARAQMPQLEAGFKETSGLIDDIINHPGLEGSVGTMQGKPIAQAFSGTFSDDAADFQERVAQLEGSAFLSAFESLKGGGQITEVEGKKATQAKARLGTAKSEKAFRGAMRDYKRVLTDIFNAVKRRSGARVSGQGTSGFAQGQQPAEPSAPVQPQGGITGQTQSGLNYRLLPQ